MALFHLRAIFVMLQLKMLNSSFFSCPGLLLCAKYRLPPLRTIYLYIYEHTHMQIYVYFFSISVIFFLLVLHDCCYSISCDMTPLQPKCWFSLDVYWNENWKGSDLLSSKTTLTNPVVHNSLTTTITVPCSSPKWKIWKNEEMEERDSQVICGTSTIVPNVGETW